MKIKKVTFYVVDYDDIDNKTIESKIKDCFGLSCISWYPEQITVNEVDVDDSYVGHGYDIAQAFERGGGE